MHSTEEQERVAVARMMAGKTNITVSIQVKGTRMKLAVMREVRVFYHLINLCK